jgi:leader peptidase (prepilin peptidase)/N-methyltransferase
MTLLLFVYTLLIGATVGSFLNVVIHRYPRSESIVFPGSHCPSCGMAIRWFDNVPLLSWTLLLGRCRGCRTTISPRYPLIELANALFYLAIVLRTGFVPGAIIIAALVSMTITLIYIDLEIQILPDVIDLPGIALGIALAAVGVAAPGVVLARSLTDSLIGAAAGAGVLLAVALTYKLVRKIEGMGLGDVKMLAMIGSVLGWRWLFAVVLIASIAGTLVGLAIVAAGTRDGLQFALPFGVFLGLAFLIVLFFGEPLAAVIPALRFIQ